MSADTKHDGALWLGEVFVIQEEVSVRFVAKIRADCNVLALSSESSDVMRQAVNQ